MNKKTDICIEQNITLVFKLQCTSNFMNNFLLQIAYLQDLRKNCIEMKIILVENKDNFKLLFS